MTDLDGQEREALEHAQNTCAIGGAERVALEAGWNLSRTYHARAALAAREEPPGEFILTQPDGQQERWSTKEAFLRACARMAAREKPPTGTPVHPGMPPRGRNTTPAREKPSRAATMSEQEAQEKVIGKVSQRDRDVWEAGRIYERIAREDTERPDGSSIYEFDDQGRAVLSDDSHWATVVIDPENFEPRELSEAEAVELDESGLGIAVERMWIRPGVRDTERPDARLTADEHKGIRCALEFGVPPGSDPLLESAKAKLRQQEALAVRDTEQEHEG
jgi:hypothetical protein